MGKVKGRDKPQQVTQLAYKGRGGGGSATLCELNKNRRKAKGTEETQNEEALRQSLRIRNLKSKSEGVLAEEIESQEVMITSEILPDGITTMEIYVNESKEEFRVSLSSKSVCEKSTATVNRIVDHAKSFGEENEWFRLKSVEGCINYENGESVKVHQDFKTY